MDVCLEKRFIFIFVQKELNRISMNIKKLPCLIKLVQGSSKNYENFIFN